MTLIRFLFYFFWLPILGNQKPTVPPQILPFSFGEDSLNPGDSTAVNCMITKGDIQNLNIKWTLNGQPIVNGENGLQVVKMSSRLSSLSIESLSDRHRGIFRCIVSNDAGETNSLSELKINGTTTLCFYLTFFKYFNYTLKSFILILELES